MPRSTRYVHPHWKAFGVRLKNNRFADSVRRRCPPLCPCSCPVQRDRQLHCRQLHHRHRRQLHRSQLQLHRRQLENFPRYCCCWGLDTAKIPRLPDAPVNIARKKSKAGEGQAGQKAVSSAGGKVKLLLASAFKAAPSDLEPVANSLGLNVCSKTTMMVRFPAPPFSLAPSCTVLPMHVRPSMCLGIRTHRRLIGRAPSRTLGTYTPYL